MEYGITFIPTDLSIYSSLIRQAESAGFSMIGVPDGYAAEYRELYVSLTLVAVTTKNVHFGPIVTCPVGRHPGPTASGLSSLHELSGGRVFFGIGRGEGAAFNLGYQTVSTTEMVEYAQAVLSLAQGKETTYQGRVARLPWARNKLPLLMVGGGPLTLRQAGKMADMVVTAVGTSGEAIVAAKDYIAQGVKERATPPSAPLPVWWMVRCGIDHDRQKALDAVLAGAAGIAKSVFRIEPEKKLLPSHLMEPMRRYIAGYDYRDHNRIGGANARAIQTLGLAPYLLERFTLAGTPEDVASQIKRAQADGADRLLIRPMGSDLKQFLALWEQEVAPRLP
ncbi:MAG: LLM class flavin-dependent oxidoreductase [Chloroflexi bacterium]|nr:LLM class flavin-dependent oxidoreductase [Chloroflexota bacterium]